MRKQSIKTLLRKTVSITLVMAMTAGVINLEGIVKSRPVVKGVESTAQNVKQEDEVKVVRELKSERTKNSNTYLMSDGSKKLEWYGDDIRYKKNGKWREYDSSLKEMENKDIIELKKTDVVEDSEAVAQYKTVNTEGDSKQYFPEELGKDTPIVMKKDEYEIAFSRKTETGDMPKKSDGEHEIVYSGGDDSTQYISLNNGVKENIVFNSRPDGNTVTYEYVLNGMYMKLDEKTNVIGIYDENDKKRAYISSPYLCDNTGINYSFNIKYDIKNNGDKWTVTETLDEKFLDSKDTKYPVTLDPTMYWMNKDYVDATNPMSGYPSDYVITGDSEMLVGTITKGFYGQAIMKWRGLEEKLKNKYISESVLHIMAKEVIGNPVIDIHPVNENWDVSGVTWNTKPSISEKLISENTGFEQGKRYNLDVKKWVQKISLGELPETYGIALCTGTENELCYMRISGTATNQCPILVVNYFDPIDMNGKYYGDFNISGEYQEDTGKIELNWDEYGNGTGNEVREYMIATRKNDGDFKMVAETDDLGYSLDIDSDTEDMDVRVVAIRKDGKYLSNILSYSRNNVTDEESQNETGTYSTVTRDTDGDGLEDGYEIWDFKTKWNTETEDSTEAEPKYVQDSDGDGLPDGYEVFTLGTDPAVKNEEGKDSDGDGWSDVREYREGTDPWLVDSDFDGIVDKDDCNDTEPRKTDNPAVNGIDRVVAYEAQVHIGLYDREFLKTGDNSCLYIINAYSGRVKSIYKNYENSTMNKKEKYFYDERGNNTAIIEENPDAPRHTICKTYKYDENDRVTFICDQSTQYSIKYEGGEITQIKVGGKTLVSYKNEIKESNFELNDEPSDGDVISRVEKVSVYGEENSNAQKIRTVMTKYNTSEENTGAKTRDISIFYNDDENASYITEVDNDGKILKFIDKRNSLNDVIYTYEYSEKSTKSIRNDGFVKEEITEKINDKNIITKNYSFKNLKGNKYTYSTKFLSDKNGENKYSQTNLYNGDIVYNDIIDTEKRNTSRIYSNLYGKDTFTSKSSIINKQNTLLSLELGDGNKNKYYDYVYDNAGNIKEIYLNGERISAYEYDVHGRLVKEWDDKGNTIYEYGYSNTGNMQAKHISSSDNEEVNIRFMYENKDWPDQLTKFNGENIIYDNSGNPIKYVDGMSFSWENGRELKAVTLKDGETILYEYNERGLRTRKKTNKEEHIYEWDNTNLIRETVMYCDDSDIYDIWYMYDTDGNIVGFEYSRVDDTKINLEKNTVYYEKNLQGDVIGLLDSRGVEFATYQYDAWGNIISTTCESGYKIPYDINCIKYRGYYRDNETGFYYLQSRYYDAKVCRFINADSLDMLFVNSSESFNDNLYIYCNGNPVNSVDYDGRWFYRFYDYPAYIATLKKTTTFMYDDPKGMATVLYNTSRSQLINNSIMYAKRRGELSEYIYEQREYPYTKMLYGCKPISYNGCEIIATYNMMRTLGKYTYFPMLIIEFSLNGMQWNYGAYGTNPEDLSRYFDAHKVSYTKYSTRKAFEKKDKKHKYYIVSFWNEYAPFNGIHTVMVKRINDKCFQVYNNNKRIYPYMYNYTTVVSKISKLYTGSGKRYSCIYGFN